MSKRLEKKNLNLRLAVDNSRSVNPTIYKQWELLNQNNLVIGKITKTQTKAGKTSYKIASTAAIGSYQSFAEHHKCPLYMEVYTKLNKAKSSLIEAIEFELTLILDRYEKKP
jgi:hypothetical protein